MPFIRRRKQKKSGPPVVYAFIDSQNLNLGVQKTGWKMNWKKFREFLQNKYGVSKAFMFVGYVQAQEDLYKKLHEAGYTVVLKPTKEMPDETVKGNVDAELVLYASAKFYNQYDKAIIVSGDGDFYCLVEYLIEKNKLLHLMAPNAQYSSLLRQFDQYVVRIDKLRRELEYYDFKKKPKKQDKH